MAYVNIPSVNATLALWKNAANAFAMRFLDNTAAVVDVSAWYALILNVYAQVNGENCLLGAVTLTGAAAFSTPQTIFTVPDSLMTSLNALPSGSFLYALQGKPTSGDDFQTIAAGSMSLTAPDDFTPVP